MKAASKLSIISAAGLLALVACKSTPQMSSRPNFLSSYNHLQPLDDLNSRYVSPVLLAQCNRFVVRPVEILVTQLQGKPVTPEQRQRSADFMRQTVINALSDRYPIVTERGPDVGEIRLALTDAYRTGGKLGLAVQGEVLDNSGTQVAAGVRTDVSEVYVADWENREAARKMVGDWAERLRKLIDEAHGQAR
jgi:hypothetical protein